MFKRFALAHNPAVGYHINLPKYEIVPYSYEPKIAGICTVHGIVAAADPVDVLAHKISVLVRMPYTTPLTKDGQIDATTLRKRYPNDSIFGDATWIPPRILGDR